MPSERRPGRNRHWLAAAPVSAVDTAAQIRSGQLSARDVMQAHLARIEAVNPTVNAIVTLHAEQALAASLAADEAHVLNVCVAPEEQGRGQRRRLLRALLQQARTRGAQRVFLEVRPSNTGAIALYHAEGFNEIGRRPRYYPAKAGREDAIVMAKELFVD